MFQKSVRKAFTFIAIAIALMLSTTVSFAQKASASKPIKTFYIGTEENDDGLGLVYRVNPDDNDHDRMAKNGEHKSVYARVDVYSTTSQNVDDADSIVQYLPNPGVEAKKIMWRGGAAIKIVVTIDPDWDRKLDIETIAAQLRFYGRSLNTKWTWSTRTLGENNWRVISNDAIQLVNGLSSYKRLYAPEVGCQKFSWQDNSACTFNPWVGAIGHQTMFAVDYVEPLYNNATPQMWYTRDHDQRGNAMQVKCEMTMTNENDGGELEFGWITALIKKAQQ